MNSRRYIFAALLGGLVLQSAFAASGRGGFDDNRGRIEERRGNNHLAGGRMTPGEAAKQAQRIHGGGRVLAVDPAGNGYRVKLLQHGDVHIVFVPAE
jgi:hypothetical protein